jgi:hypothetical protein
MTLEVILTRDVDVQEYRVVMEISKTEKRDDILSVLKLADETREPISAETICRKLLADRPTRVGENIIRRLNGLGLLYNRRLSEKGREALEWGQVFMPQRGSYRIYCTKDPLLPQVLLNLKEEGEIPRWDFARKKKQEEDSAVPLPEWLKEIEGNVVQLLGRDSETIRVEEVEGKCLPKGSSGGAPLSISLVLRMSGHNELSLSGRFERRLPPPDIRFEDVWMSVLGDRSDDWSKEVAVLLCSFDDLSDSDRRTFTINLELKAPLLPVLGKFKRTVIRNVPVAPRHTKDAQQWAEWLLIETLPGYVSEEEYETHMKQVSASFPRHQIRLPGQEELAKSALGEEWKFGEGGPMRKEYWYLRAPIDLNPGGG